MTQPSTTPAADIDYFFKAIAAGDDNTTELFAQQLQATDEAQLLRAVESDDGELRWWAVRGLALIGGEHSVAVLAALLQASDPLLRAAALMALASIHKRQPAAVNLQLEAMAHCLADTEGIVRQSASDALAQCGNDAVPVLAEVLKGDHQGARTRAAQALRQIATMPAAAVLYRVLNDSNYMVHTYAYEGLEKMGLLETMLLVV